MRTILILLAALAFALPVDASHCTTYTTSMAELDTGLAGGSTRYYVDNDWCPQCHLSLWIYQESNGIDGLQRADEVVDDTCHDMIRGDTIIF